MEQIKYYSDSYLYNKKHNIEKNVINYIMSSEIIDKSDKSFEDIRYDIKRRQVTSSLVKVLDSPNIILLRGKVGGASKAFKVFAAKDIKSGDNKTKVFVDTTDIISGEAGAYTMNDRNVDIFVSYLVNVMVTYIYFIKPEKLVNNTSIIDNGTECYADMVSYIIDYMRIGNVDKIRERTKYLAALNFQCGLLCKPLSESIRNRARKLSGLSNRETDVVDFLMGDERKVFKNANNFVEALGKVLKIDDKLNIDNVMERWAWVFGSGTEYGLELFAPFSSIITNAYVGAYVNNQKNIEKICGRSLVDYTNAVFKVGSELV